jgi:hypothetical protein
MNTNNYRAYLSKYTIFTEIFKRKKSSAHGGLSGLKKKEAGASLFHHFRGGEVFCAKRIRI